MEKAYLDQPFGAPRAVIYMHDHGLRTAVTMPLYMDTHDGTDLPTDLRRKVESRVRSGEKDEYGVVDRGVIIDRDAGEMHCVLDAPDEEAIRRHHEWLNVPLDRETIHRADAILK